AGDEGRAVGFQGAGNRVGYRLWVLAVDMHGVPAGRPEARHLVDRVGERQGAVDRDAVVVEEEDQLRQLEVTGKRDRFMADAFHEVAVRAEHEGPVVDDVVTELGGKDAFRERHANRGADALAEWTRGCLDAGGNEILG